MLFAMFWIKRLMLCGSMPMLGATPLSCGPHGGLPLPPIRRCPCQCADHELRFLQAQASFFSPLFPPSPSLPPLSLALSPFPSVFCGVGDASRASPLVDEPSTADPHYPLHVSSLLQASVSFVIALTS